MAELGIGIASLMISVPALIDAVVRLADSLLEKAKLHLHIEDCRQLCEHIINLNKSQSRDLLFFFHSIGDFLSQDFQDELQHLFQSLRSVYENLIKAFPANKVSSASVLPSQQKLSGRDIKRIETGIKQLEEWNDRFLKRAIVFLFLGNSKLPSSGERERALRSYEVLDHVNLLRKAVQATILNAKVPEKLHLDQLDSTATRVQVPHSSSWTWQPAQGAPDCPARLIEDRLYSDDADTATVNAIRKLVRDIATILHEAEPKTMGVLRCCGFRQERLQNRFELHFEFPEDGHNPHSLQDLLKSPINQRVGVAHPLNHRISLAKKLASAVFFLHSGGFVHKNIRPSNIMIFEPILTKDMEPSRVKYYQYLRAIGAPFLVGYDGVRKVEAASQRIRVEDWKKNIYLSPERHRLKIGDEFTMQHDVYSLGVVLLEIALWTDFTDRSSRYVQKLWQDQGTLKPAVQLQEIFIDSAKTDIPRLLGQKYCDAVVACLTSLREDEETGSLTDQDGIVVGLAYITQVITRLEEISV